MIPQILTEDEKHRGVIAMECPIRHIWYKMYPFGIGKYPYPCIRQDKSPNAMVYRDAEGTGWDTTIDWREVEPSYFQHKSIVEDNTRHYSNGRRKS